VKTILILLALSSHLFNVSGSGKTRLSLDGLCCHWGFYISCRTEIGTASGSNDFMVAIEMLQTMNSWRADPPDFSNNSTAAHRAFAILLCARVVILEQLVKQFNFLPIQTSRMLDADGSLLKFCLPVWWKTSLSQCFGPF
jgi:hypothetical protein